jgi:hypothetical protein
MSDDDIGEIPDYDPDAPTARLYSAIEAGDAQKVKKILRDHPEELRDYPGVAPTWLHFAAGEGQAAVVDIFLAAGMDVNEARRLDEDTPLNYAVRYGQLATARYLLSLGADPSACRMLIGALNAKENSFELVKLLVEHGADVNQVWRFGDEEKGFLFNALSWAIDGGRHDIAAYLRAHGAVIPPEEQAGPPTSAAEQIVAHFERQFGKVDKRALQEIVPTSDPPIAIHRIGPTEERNSVILFTTGMSNEPMIVPEGGEEFALAELVIELPADWPLAKNALANPSHRWPVDWLRRVAAYPRNEQTWLGGMIAVMANADPPDQFAPDCRFTSMLLLAGYHEIGPIVLSDGRTVQIYSLVPLYEDERQLELSEGVPELFRRLDEFGVNRIVDTGRRSVASVKPA